ncbi:hypothetical protein FRB95_003575 [Tulasnella sp. JGI-2019a]|nr:hypothetical protein FRB95_003575 [Tulasnella sp. JGI-2019a]
MSEAEETLIKNSILMTRDPYGDEELVDETVDDPKKLLRPLILDDVGAFCYKELRGCYQKTAKAKMKPSHENLTALACETFVIDR